MYALKELYQLTNDTVLLVVVRVSLNVQLSTLETVQFAISVPMDITGMEGQRLVISVALLMLPVQVVPRLLSVLRVREEKPLK